MKLLLAALLFTNFSHALYKDRDLIANMCWKDSKDKSHCLKDTDGYTRVLLYSASWCGPCKNEHAELVKRTLKKDVIYYSILCDVPKVNLDSWDRAYGLSKLGIRVVAAPYDCARDFEGHGPIPAVSVITPERRLKAFAINPGVDWILRH